MALVAALGVDQGEEPKALTLYSAWSSSYLQSLQARSWWKQIYNNLHVWDLVLVVDEIVTDTQQWPMGRVLKVYPKRDGLV